MREHIPISHNLSQNNLDIELKKIIKKIQSQGDKPYASVSKQLEILDELTKFEMGKFIILNRGIDGYWTHYITSYPHIKNNIQNKISNLERFLLEKAPSALATQQRFNIFIQENQKSVKNDYSLACIPSGMMGELLHLNFNKINAIKLTGIDYDDNTLKQAKELAYSKQLGKYINFIKEDAWKLKIKDEFDLISSNGLNIYEPNDDRIVLLYKIFHKALKHNGKIITSTLTPPPGLKEKCKWDLEKVNQDDLLLQKIIFSDILNIKWQCYRSVEKTKQQLQEAGFANIKVIYDSAHIFPTITAIKQNTL